jgi:hypothetical protein
MRQDLPDQVLPIIIGRKGAALSLHHEKILRSFNDVQYDNFITFFLMKNVFINEI